MFAQQSEDLETLLLRSQKQAKATRDIPRMLRNLKRSADSKDQETATSDSVANRRVIRIGNGNCR
jgi:hypothetical protein